MDSSACELLDIMVFDCFLTPSLWSGMWGPKLDYLSVWTRYGVLENLSTFLIAGAGLAWRERCEVLVSDWMSIKGVSEELDARFEV